MAVHSINFHLILVVLAVSFGTGFQIYSASVVNNIEHHLRIWLNDTSVNRYGKGLSDYGTDILWATIVSCVAVGATVGAASVPLASKYFGRKPGLVLTGLLSILGAIFASLSKASSSFELLIIGRLFIGCSLGLGMALAGMYTTEIAPLEHRGACGAVIGLFFGLGDLLSIALTLPEGLGTDEYWPIAMALPAIPAALQVLTMFWAPESPRTLYLTKKDHTRAASSIKFFQTDIQAEQSLTDLSFEQSSIDASSTTSPSVWQFLKSTIYKRRLLITITLNTAIVSSGINAVMSYSTSILQQSGISLINAERASTGIGACNFLMPLVTIFCVDKAGRRILTLSGIIGCFCSILALTIVTGMKMHEAFHDSMILSYICIGCLIGYQICFGIAQPVTMFMTSEFFEQDVRAYGMSVANVVFFGVGALQLLAFPPFARAVGISFSFIPFVAITAICLLFLYFELPETKGKRVEDIVKELARQKPNVI